MSENTPLDRPSGTLSTVLPIVTRFYGNASMPRALAAHLAEKIDAYTPKPDALEDEDRERMVMLTCWNWFSGGTTAQSVARRIEEALGACEHDWRYLERKPGEDYTGYCEQCSKCGEIVQVPQ